ncbi:MAG: hypothetical protein U0L26_02845 [Cellulosilyticum sp.]|nr:hypothetical protein [Cellulosilyticum sp.]
MLESEACGKNCQFNRFKIGEMDGSGRKIEQIIYIESNKYMIYFVEKEYLKPYYIDAYDFFAPFSETFQKKLSEVQSINVKNKKKNEFIRHEIASAYYNAINGYNEVAIGELEVLKNKLMYRAYAWWFTTYTILCSIMATISLVLYLMQGMDLIDTLVYSMTASSIGSLLMHTRKDSEVGITTFLPSIAAYIHFLGAIVSGVLIYCILKSNLLLGEFSNNPATMILVCFVAGYSEDIPLKLMDKIGAMFGGDQLKGK